MNAAIGGGDQEAQSDPMIESISAITLATHDMRRAVRFYIALLASLALQGGKPSVKS